MSEKTVKDVQEFWDANPLLTGEVSAEPGTREFFEQFDVIKTHDIFLGDLSRWVHPGLLGKRVLDVGCGPGYWNRRLGAMDLDYYGVDISPNSVALAKKSRKHFGLKGSIEVGNAEALPFADGFFDHVLSEGVIHHTPDTQKCVDEIHRVLKPGGTVCISFYHKNIILRNTLLFKLTLFFMRLFRIGLKGRGREQMVYASSPEELIRMYDGADNPVGKAYTKKDLRAMFSKFTDLRFSYYYIVPRAFPVPLPKFLLSAAARTMGLMILVEGRKAGA